VRFDKSTSHARPKSARVSSTVGAVPLSMIRLALFLKKLSILFSPHEKALDHVCDRGDRVISDRNFHSITRNP
jgi:hypothetical protein